MAVAALIAWLATAVGGFVMLGTWVAKGGSKRGTSHLPPAVIFSHFALAAIGLVLWIIYMLTDNHTFAWVGFVLLVPVALLGFVMLVRWIPVYRSRAVAGSSPRGQPDLAEKHFPVGVVAGHGIFAVATVILVLLAALEL